MANRAGYNVLSLTGRGLGFPPPALQLNLPGMRVVVTGDGKLASTVWGLLGWVNQPANQKYKKEGTKSVDLFWGLCTAKKPSRSRSESIANTSRSSNLKQASCSHHWDIGSYGCIQRKSRHTS